MTEFVADLRSDSPQLTRRIAAAIAGTFEAGDVIALSGELGAGKTCFVQGAAHGLGVADRVTSPTFVLVRTYAGRVRLVHCDIYRLATLQDVYDLGEEVLADDVVTMIEWGDAVRGILPDQRLEVEIVHEDVDSGVDGARVVRLRAYGRNWSERAQALIDLSEPWTRTG